MEKLSIESEKNRASKRRLRNEERINLRLTISTLSSGEHAVVVKATDSEGNVGALLKYKLLLESLMCTV